MKVEPLLQPDLHSISKLQPEGWSDIRLKFKYYIEADFCFPFKITFHHEIIAIGAIIIHDKVAWLGHIIVEKNFRNKGIGKRITQALIDFAKSKHCETIYLLATELGEIIYRKLGFFAETQYLFFENLKINHDWKFSKQIIPYDQQFEKQILAIDQLTSKENRTRSLSAALSNSSLYVEENILQGFYLPDLGEGLIIATDTRAGIELMKVHLTSNNKIIFPNNNLSAIKFMQQHGLEASRTATRMRLGKKRNVLFENIFNRIAGNIG